MLRIEHKDEDGSELTKASPREELGGGLGPFWRLERVEDGGGGGGGGFIFAQLGALYVFAGPCNWEETLKQGPEAITEGPWKATSFGVVVQLDMQGRPGSVWAIYNFYADNDESTERFHIPVVDDLT